MGPQVALCGTIDFHCPHKAIDDRFSTGVIRLILNQHVNTHKSVECLWTERKGGE